MNDEHTICLMRQIVRPCILRLKAVKELQVRGLGIQGTTMLEQTTSHSLLYEYSLGSFHMSISHTVSPFLEQLGWPTSRIKAWWDLDSTIVMAGNPHLLTSVQSGVEVFICLQTNEYQKDVQGILL